MKTVSVIIAAYRAEAFIKDALLSVLAQQIPNDYQLQLVLGIDGCDATHQAVSRIYDDRLHVYKMKRNCGTYVTFNTMMGFATGELIARFDADDIMLDGYLRKQIEVLEEHPDVHLCWTQNRYIDEHSEPIAQAEPFKDEWAVRSASDGQFLLRREIWSTLGGFQAWPCNSDTDFLHRFRFLGYKEYGVQEALFLRRIHPGSLTQADETGYDSMLRKDIRDIMFRERDNRTTREQARVEPVVGELAQLPLDNRAGASCLQSSSSLPDRAQVSPPRMECLTPEDIRDIACIYETVLKPEERKNRLKQHINPQATLCVFASPRGGSTWLGEILSEIPETVLCCEPLYRLREFSDLKFTWHQPIPAGTIWPRAEEVFRKLLNREILRYEVYFQSDLQAIPGAARHIFKFCHGNMLLEWFTDHFAVQPILLVRHPCAVISSQMLHQGWAKLKDKPDHRYSIGNFPFNEIYYLYEDILKTVKTWEENLAATWCLAVVHSLMSQANDVKWITVAYENLYVNYEDEMERIFGRLGIDVPASVYKRRRIVSKSTNRSSAAPILSGKQLASWKNHLSLKQQNNIMGIVKAFGINHYSLDLEPDLDAMYAV